MCRMHLLKIILDTTICQEWKQMNHDILMNISEIESPNYEYVELYLLNLPWDLSKNLNEDSDNQKENVVPSKRFRMVTDEETGEFFLEENLNKNTKTKKWHESDHRLFHFWWGNSYE